MEAHRVRRAERIGQYRRVSRTVHGTEAQASRALRRLAAEVRGPIDPVTSTPPWTLTELVARYLGHLEHTERSPANVRRYRGLLSGWIGPAVGTANPSDVTPGDVDQLLAQMHAAGQSASSTHQARTLLRSAYRWARMTYSIRHNPARADRL